MSVGAREPCPCGSGRRYKACHGKDAARAAVAFVARPFEGLDHETSFVAMREILPAATMKASLKSGGEVTFVTILPEQSAAMRTSTGRLLIGMQIPTGTGDPSRDLAAAIIQGQNLADGELMAAAPMGGSDRLQELLAKVESARLHDAFDFWELEGEDVDQSSHALIPTKPLGDDAYWCDFPDRTVIRWVIADDEDGVLDALARLSASGALPVTEDSKYLGAFRADGIMIPVWQIRDDVETIAAPMNALRQRFAEARKATTALTDAERRARSGLIGRNLTIR
jgi:hypothetical protein